MKTGRILSLFLTLAVLIWSGLAPQDRMTWWLETLPVFIGIPLLIYFEKRSKVTLLLFILICLHSLVLSVGGHYTYAEVPVGFWAEAIFGWTRNHYDRLGHFFQGLQPAILSREVLRRNKILTPGKSGWLWLFCLVIPLAFSAFYELVEWSVALVTGEDATAFLGTQGDIWDTQWDMFMALIGALAALLLFSRLHETQIQKISNSSR